MTRLLLAAALALGGVAPAVAAPVDFGGRADARVGYGSNPYVQGGSSSRSSAIFGFNINPTLRRTFATGSTSLSGGYSREQYLNNLGHPDTAQIVLQHNQELNPKLSMNASVSYTSSSNALGGLGIFGQNLGTLAPPIETPTDTATGVGTPIGSGNIPLTNNYIDPLTIGLRTRRYGGDASFSWRPSSRDTVSLSGGYAHGLPNRRGGIASYDFYNANLTYTRPIGSRMQLGGSIGYTRSESKTSGSVSSYEPSIVLSYKFSEIWTFSGNVGATFRRIPSLGETSTGLGFNASLCGNYPKTGVCVTGSRVTSASGIGGARINTNLGMSLTQQLTSNDSARASVSYVDSKSVGGLFGAAQQFTQVDGGWDHRIGERWVVGIDGRFQTRTQDFVSNARAMSVTARVGYLFGRVS